MTKPLNQIEIDFKAEWDIDEFDPDGKWGTLEKDLPVGKWFVDRATSMIYSPSGVGREVEMKWRYNHYMPRFVQLLLAKDWESAEFNYAEFEDALQSYYNEGSVMEKCTMRAYIKGYELGTVVRGMIYEPDDREKSQIEEELKAECIEQMRGNKDKFVEILEYLKLL